MLRYVGTRLREDEIGHLVGPQVRVQQRRIRARGLNRIKDGRQLLVVDHNQPGRLFGNLFCGGHHAGHRLADVAHAIPGKDRTVDEVQTDVLRYVRPRDHSLHTRQFQGPAGVHLLDQSVGVGTARQPSVQQAWSPRGVHVIGENGGSSDLFVHIDAGYTLAHRLGRLLFHWVPGHAIPSPCRLPIGQPG